MKTYIGTKIIQAEVQTKDGKEGYKVVYPDGYISWSPKEAFEEAYRETEGMSFGLAVEAMRKGMFTTRARWSAFNNTTIVARIIPSTTFVGEVIEVKGFNNEWDLYHPIQEDSLANDWVITP